MKFQVEKNNMHKVTKKERKRAQCASNSTSPSPDNLNNTPPIPCICFKSNSSPLDPSSLDTFLSHKLLVLWGTNKLWGFINLCLYVLGVLIT